MQVLAMFKRMSIMLKTTNLPFRSVRFVGFDLDSNMYFEGKPVHEGMGKTRRSVEYYSDGDPYANYRPDRVPPAWQAWMRHTVANPPTLQDLQREKTRLEDVLAKVAVLHSKKMDSVSVDAVQNLNAIDAPQEWVPNSARK